MALAIGTSPALASKGDAVSVTTSSFTRAAGSLLVAMVMCTSDGAPTVSGGGLTWTRRSRRVGYDAAYAEVWTAPVTGTGSMTVTVGVTGTDQGVAVKVDAVTGQHPTAPIGQSGNGESNANNANVTGYSSSVAGSRGFLASIEMSGAGTPSSTDTAFPWSQSVGGGFYIATGMAVRKAANTSSAGTAVTFNLDASGTSAAEWFWAALEIVPASTETSVEITTVAVVSAVPSPTVSLGAEPTPTTVQPAVALPAPGVSAGVGATTAPVAATVAVPLPMVSTEEVELAQLDPIALAVGVPTPEVHASAAPTAEGVGAVVAMPSPTVQVHADVIMGVVALGVAVPVPVVTVPILPGDRISRPGQIEWNGTLLGSGTSYGWRELTGWRETPPVVLGNIDQPLGHGSYPGQPYAGERVINWATIIKVARSDMEQVLLDLEDATGVAESEDELPLVINDLGTSYLVYAHLTNRTPGPIDRRARLGVAQGALQWTCSDPRRYSVLRYSVTLPRDVETDVLNAGNAAAPYILRVPGPCVHPQIENATLDRVIAFNLTVPSGSRLEIDTKNGSVAIGTADHLHDLVEGSTSVKDFVLAPGANTILFTCDSGGDAGLDVLWRHARN
ncbi:hypothetical protein ACFY19_20680 [Streptosporangium saharense]|uniref:hypothetical protein n=1 Tax=Streptosporangium saharense TaxID=1706840 RepID=UPI0036C16838